LFLNPPKKPSDKQPKTIASAQKQDEKPVAEKQPAKPEEKPRPPREDATPKPEPKPQTASAPPKPRPRPTPAPRPEPKPRLSPLDILKNRYGSDNLLEVAEKALGQRKYDDAIKALESAEGGAKRSLMLLEAYVESGQMSKARSFGASEDVNDAWFDLLKGRVEDQSGNNKKALALYQEALLKPSAVRSRTQIRNDALFYTARIHDQYYRNAPESKTRLQALNSWNVLKRCYISNPDHPRFKMANEKMATIQ
jgi:hypothetical protein